jgi:hypothetical protein
MKSFTLLILICFLAFSACKKDNKLIYAIIRDGGDPAVDGCGWLIEMSNETFKPKNLSDEFKVNGMEVEIKYDKLDDMANCGLSQDAFHEISLREIHKLTN